MKTAIVGLPRVGKTSLFTILTGAHVIDSEGVVGDFKTKITVENALRLFPTQGGVTSEP